MEPKNEAKATIMTAKRAKTVCLQGKPGSGKSLMACATAINKPVHCIDIDRKVLSADWAQPLLATGDLTVWELEEPVDKTNFANRIISLTKELSSKGPAVPPQGWSKFGEYLNAHDDPDWIKARTVVIDSATILNEHLKTFIMFQAKRSKYVFDQWTALKIGWLDTMSALRDLHREHNKDLIFTVHERDKIQPGDRTTGVRTELVKSGEGLEAKEVFQGVQEVEVWASIDGSYGELIGATMDEYYFLFVEMDNGTPHWRCRVHPDGKRALRTSFSNKEAVYDPDFGKIWR